MEALAAFSFEYRNDSGGLVGEEYLRFNSLEKLWLALVMKECYLKIWDHKREIWTKRE